MAYSPGQPWDKTLSYSYLQTCTYNGLPYVFWRQDGNSTVGVEPNKEEALFKAVNPATGAIQQRLERCWVLADYINGEGVRYGSVRREQADIRGVADVTTPIYDFPYSSAQYFGPMYHGYWSPYIGQKSEYSWPFYGQFYGQSGDLGLPNTTPGLEAPVYDGNGNVAIAQNYDIINQFGSPEGSGAIPYLTSVPPVIPNPQPPRTLYLDFIFRVIDGLEQEISLPNAFGRTAHYTITVDDWNYSVYPYTKTTYTVDGTASTGPFRDRYADIDTYVRSSHVFSWAEGHSIVWSIKINDITPRFDA